MAPWIRLTGGLCVASLLSTVAVASDIEPEPAEMMPLAGERLLLDVVNTGPRFVAVGQRGHILASLDGQEWVQSPVPTRATLTAVDFAGTNHGWAVGHDAVIVRTDDGGATWSLQNFEPEKEQPLLDVLFLDQERGFAVGAYSMFYETRDGGQSWTAHESDIIEDGWHFNAIERLGGDQLVIVGESGTVAFSSDAGDTWEKVDSPYEGSYFGALPHGDAGVLIFGLRGNAYITESIDDIAWTRVQTGTEQTLLGGARLDSGDAVLVGLNGTILRAPAGSTQVQRVNHDVGVSLNDVLDQSSRLLLVGVDGSHVIDLQ